MHGQATLLPVLLGLFLGWLSLSLGAPIGRIQEIPAAINDTHPPGRDPNATATIAPTRPANETKPVVPTADADDKDTMHILNSETEDTTTNRSTAAPAAAAGPASPNVTNATAAPPAAAGQSDAAANGADADAAAADNDAAADDAADEGDAADSANADAADAGPCAKQTCTPVIDGKASVIESYKRHRAQAALIGDFGSCLSGPGTGKKLDDNSTSYTWTVDWGDDESYELKKETIGPYQAEHVYAKKGKYTVEATFCHHVDDCDSGCTTMSKTINVKP